jgi:hypothetical protein
VSDISNICLWCHVFRFVVLSRSMSSYCVNFLPRAEVVGCQRKPSSGVKADDGGRTSVKEVAWGPHRAVTMLWAERPGFFSARGHDISCRHRIHQISHQWIPTVVFPGTQQLGVKLTPRHDLLRRLRIRGCYPVRLHNVEKLHIKPYNPRSMYYSDNLSVNISLLLNVCLTTHCPRKLGVKSEAR